MSFRFEILGLALVAAFGPAYSGAVRTWSPASPTELATGELDGVAVDALGRLRLAPTVDEVWGPDRGVVWAIQPSADGAGAFAALSDPARVVQVGHGREPRTWYDGEAHAWVTALAVGRGDRVWAGTSPKGQVLEIPEPLRSARTIEVGASYVWALAIDERGDLWIGTGAPGRVLRVRRGEERAETVHETGDDAVRSLVATPGGGVIAGTASRGRVLRIDGGGAVEVWFDAEEEEIVALALEPGGALWALASKETRPAPTTARTDGPEAVEGQPRALPAEAGNDESAPRATEAGGSSVTVRASGGSPGASTPTGGAALYRLEPGGGATRVWSSKGDIAYALTLDAVDRAWVGVGETGRVQQVDDSGQVSAVAELASTRITALARDRGGRIVVGTAADARILFAGPDTVRVGWYVGPAVDAGGPADWGRVAWTGTGEQVDLAVRTGNSSEPDETWSEWVASGHLPPGGRFAQVRAGLSAGSAGAGPIVERLELAYAPRNRPPRIETLGVEPAGVAWVRQVVPSGPRGGLQVADDPAARRIAADEAARAQRNAPIRKSYEPGVRTFTWDAKDEDGDRLVASLEFRRVGDEGWTPLAGALEDSFHSWDARGMPDGSYRVRLTVDDRLDNAAGAERSAQRVSEPFFLDGTAPLIEELELQQDRETLIVRFTARDPGGRIEAVEFAVGDGPFRLARPEDGLTDSAEERFVIRIDDVTVGVRLRVSDRAGNLAGDVVRAVAR